MPSSLQISAFTIFIYHLTLYHTELWSTGWSLKCKYYKKMEHYLGSSVFKPQTFNRTVIWEQGGAGHYLDALKARRTWNDMVSLKRGHQHMLSKDDRDMPSKGVGRKNIQGNRGGSNIHKVFHTPFMSICNFTWQNSLDITTELTCPHSDKGLSSLTSH